MPSQRRFKTFSHIEIHHCGSRLWVRLRKKNPFVADAILLRFIKSGDIFLGKNNSQR